MVFILMLFVSCMAGFTGEMQASEGRKPQTITNPLLDPFVAGIAGKKSVHNFKALPDDQQLMLAQSCRKNKQPYDDEIATLITLGKVPAWQDKYIEHKVGTNKYAQAKFRQIESRKALQAAADSKKLAKESELSLGQAFLLNESKRKLCTGIIGDTVIEETPTKKRAVVYVDTEKYHAIAQLPPDIRKGLGKRVVVVNRTFYGKLKHVGYSTAFGCIGGACLGATAEALGDSTVHYKNLLMQQGVEAIAKPMAAAVTGVVVERCLPALDAAVKDYASSTVDGPFGSFSDTVPQFPAINGKQLLQDSINIAMTTASTTTQDLVVHNPPSLNPESLAAGAIKGGFVGGIAGFLRGWSTKDKPVEVIKIGKIGRKR